MLIEKSIQDIAAAVGGTIVGSCGRSLTGVSSLSEATENDVSFLGNEKYVPQVLPSRASVVLVPPAYTEQPPEGRAWVVCDDPSYAFTQIVKMFTPPPTVYEPGVHPTAVIAPDAIVPPSAHIGAGVVIEAGASIGEGTVLLPHVFIGRNCHVGANCLFYANVVVNERCIIGNRVILHGGVVIGSDGFGYKSGPEGHEKIPQVGIVQIDDDVEIGGNSCVDRARFGRTWIQAGTKIDNLVQVGHNVEIGRCCMIVAQVGIAGSTHLGNGVILAGQAGISGHLKLADGTIVMAQAGISKDTAPGAVLMGTPAVDRREFVKERLLIKKIEKLQQELRELKSKLNG